MRKFDIFRNLMTQFCVLLLLEGDLFVLRNTQNEDVVLIVISLTFKSLSHLGMTRDFG